MGGGVLGAKEEGSRTEMRPVTNLSASHSPTAGGHGHRALRGLAERMKVQMCPFNGANTVVPRARAPPAA